jgi:hypothetical protein
MLGGRNSAGIEALLAFDVGENARFGWCCHQPVFLLRSGLVTEFVNIVVSADSHVYMALHVLQEFQY